LAYLTEVRQLAETAAPGKPVLVYVPQQLPEGELRAMLDTARSFSGVVLGDAQREPGTRRERVGGGASLLSAELSKVRLLRESLGERSAVVAAGGVHQPEDALALLAAGATSVMLHSGLVYAGPGLPKRINEAILYDRITAPVASTDAEALPYEGSVDANEQASNSRGSVVTSSDPSTAPQREEISSFRPSPIFTCTSPCTHPFLLGELGVDESAGIRDDDRWCARVVYRSDDRAVAL
jgi:dihydroorotate dehydrogenase